MKKFFSSLIFIAVLLLAACGESKSDKEVVSDAFKSMMEAKSYEATSDIKLNLEADINDPFVAPYIQMINDIELSLDTIFDSEKELQEIVVHFTGTISPMTFNLDLPILQDLSNGTMYIATDSLVDNFGMMFGLPEDIKGKIIAIEADDLDGEFINADEDIEKAQKVVLDFLNEKSDDDFSKDGNVYTVKFNEDDLVAFVQALLKAFDDEFTAQDLEDFKQELEKGLEQIDFNQFEVQLTVEKDELKAMKFVIDVGVEDEGESISIGLTIDTQYKSLNKAVEFSIDPENSEIIDMTELEEIMFEYMYGF